MKHITTKSVIVCLGVIGGSSAAFAEGDHGGIHENPQFGTNPVASVGITGSEEKHLVMKSTVGHYTVCNHGHHSVMMTHDETGTPVGSGDCVAVEAKNIKVAGTNDDAKNRVNAHVRADNRGNHGDR